MNELIEAWSLWFSGKLADSFTLWGIEMLWWGRIGRFLQTFAILTVIVEIIGEERLIKFGSSLHELVSIEKARHLIKDAIRYKRAYHLLFINEFKKTFLEFFGITVDQVSRTLKEIREMDVTYADSLKILKEKKQNAIKELEDILEIHPSIRLIFLFLIFGYIVTLGYVLWGLMNWWEYLGVMVIAIGIYEWLIPYIMIFVLLLLSIIGLIIDVVAIKPIAWIISHPQLDMLVKVAALIATIVGVHFVFLAS